MAEKPHPIKQRVLLVLLFGFAIYTPFVYTTGTHVTAEPAHLSDATRKGKLLYQKYNCTACHQFYGMGGYIGPDLTNVMSAPGKGELYVRALLMSGSEVMPDYDLPEDEIDAFVAFLKYVDQTGRFPERNVKWTWYGSITLPDSTL